jgi:phosphate:Na+ symporter
MELNWLDIIFRFFGGLGFFFYGMKQFSESLQSMGSSIIQSILNGLTSNRILGTISGIIITCLIQSSSVTTVMTIGFVNAGLMSLAQAISIVFGANIGTTITGWIIAIKLGKIGIHMVGVGAFPMLFVKEQRFQKLGRIIFGLGLVFFGLETMGNSFKPLRTYEPFLNMLTYFDAMSLTSVLACVLIGCFLTMIIQSSSASLGITIAMATAGTITFETSAALVLGQNIGTTITAILASVGTNTNAKRTATAHAIFNVVGVLVMVIIFRPYLHFIEWLIPNAANAVAENGTRPDVAAHIAASHTVFNVVATLFFLPFLNHLANLVTRIIPEPGYKEVKKLEFIGEPETIPPVMAIAQVYSELKHMGELIRKLICNAKNYVLSDSENKRLRDAVIKYEDISDNMQKEIMVFICKLMERPLTGNQTIQLNSMLSIADDLESIGDYCRNLVQFRQRLFDNKHSLTDETKAELEAFANGVLKLYDHVLLQLVEPLAFKQGKFEGLFRQMKENGEKIKDSHLDRIKQGVYSPLSGLTFSDLIVAMRKTMGHISGMNKALNSFPF